MRARSARRAVKGSFFNTTAGAAGIVMVRIIRAAMPRGKKRPPARYTARMNGDALELQLQVACFLDALNCGAALLHRSGTLLHVNPRLGAMLRRDAAQLVDQNIRTLYPRPDEAAAIDDLLTHFDEEREAEFFLPLPDGTHLPIIASGRRLPAAWGLTDLRVVTLIDITAQKRAEAQVREQHRAIAQLSDSLLQQALALQARSRVLAEDLRSANLDAIYMLAVASEAKDADTGFHVRRIQKYSEALALEAGLEREEAEMLGISAILHDVGKLLVPDEILKKPGQLTEEERRTMELHTIVGERMLPDKPFFRSARQIARSHHENWDGGGYPDQLVGEAIPLAARIVHIVDVYDALTSERVYKDAVPASDALRHVQSAAARAFDPRLVLHFTDLQQRGRFRELREELVAEFEAGTWDGDGQAIRLSDDR